MCGIAGLILRHGSPHPRMLATAAARLAHRGPDDSGIWCKDGVGLAHTRLSIIDLGGGRQPIHDPAGQYALIANGEVYNFVELRAELQREGCQFSTGSDSETILQVYARHGVAGLRRLNGMFAFALYATRERSLVLGRDRLGIKPLYYAERPDRIVFASELKALLPLLPQVPAPCARGLDAFLEGGFNSSADTILQGVRKLAPGSALIIDPELRTRTFTYWSALESPLLDLNQGQAHERFAPLFEQVLQEHRRSDVPYGLFLSGGIDSGTLLAQLSRWGDRPLRTFSVGYQQSGREADELSAAREIATRFGTDHTELRLHPDALFQALPLAVWAADEPLYDPACLPTLLMARVAATELKVVFTGEGGDEVFAGYGRYRRARLQQTIKQLLHPATGGYRRGSRWPHRLRRAAFTSDLWQARGAYRQPIAAAWAQTPRAWGFLRRAQYTDLRTELVDGLLVKVDRTLMACGLEGRVPFLDHRIVEFGLGLPDPLKVQGRVGKLFLRRWAEPLLSGARSGSRKQGFGVPLDPVFQDPLLGHLGARLARSRLLRDWIKPGFIPTLIAMQRHDGRATEYLLQLTQLALWERLLLEDPRSTPPEAAENPLDWLA